mgnify:CR=1 FL=1
MADNTFDIFKKLGEFDKLILIAHKNPLGGVPYKFLYKKVDSDNDNFKGIFTEEIVCLEQDGTFSNERGDSLFLKEVFIDAETHYYAKNETDFKKLLNERLKKDEVKKSDIEHRNSSIKLFVKDLNTAKKKLVQLRKQHGDVVNVSKRVSTINKLKKYLEEQLTGIKSNEIKEPTKNIKFNITQTELLELTKALIENGNLKGKQKDIINSFKQFFDIEINNPDKIIHDIKKRNIGSETLFIDKLKSSLYDYVTKENKR